MKKYALLAIFIGLPALALAALYAYVFYTGPRMKVQPHIRAYQTVAPLPPKGTVPVQAPSPLPSAAEAGRFKNPLSESADTLGRGKVYYEYYCVFCHGDEGAGDGPVGESYVPKPADLRGGKIAAYDDGTLLRGMLTGIGHQPVLEQVVPQEHRWYLVAFVRSLQKR
ncbi:cytochrome C [Geomonas sp. RF6]|uniref:c-type cytochrome n=1 Tax=Geomonas sp. RF6 TaxID=2897342 RepID=UPI001E39B8A8|nr:c-type cytochrome [Geomonas sp. RF6]UFS70366.1 cytochrome C [Geomonas sp. RF6]